LELGSEFNICGGFNHISGVDMYQKRMQHGLMRDAIGRSGLGVGDGIRSIERRTSGVRKWLAYR
jgi:hypothetical protein